MFWEGFLFLSALCSASRSEKGAWHLRRKCGMVFRSHGKIARCLGLAPGKPLSPAQTCFSPVVEASSSSSRPALGSHVCAVSFAPLGAKQDSLPQQTRGLSCLPASPLRDDGPTRVPSPSLPPASLFWRFPSPAGIGLGFRLQLLFWSRKRGCWAPLGDSLPPPGWHRAPGISSSWGPPSQFSQGHVRHRTALGLSPLPAIFHVTPRLSQDGATSSAVTAQPSANRLVQTVRQRAWVPLPAGASSRSPFPVARAACFSLLPVLAAQPFPKGARGNGVMKLSVGLDTS